MRKERKIMTNLYFLSRRLFLIFYPEDHFVLENKRPKLIFDDIKWILLFTKEIIHALSKRKEKKKLLSINDVLRATQKVVSEIRYSIRQRPRKS